MLVSKTHSNKLTNNNNNNNNRSGTISSIYIYSPFENIRITHMLISV